MVLSLDAPLFLTQSFSLASLLEDKQILVTSGSKPKLATGRSQSFYNWCSCPNTPCFRVAKVYLCRTILKGYGKIFGFRYKFCCTIANPQDY